MKISPQVKQKIFRANPVHFALQESVAAEIKRLQEEDIIETVDKKSTPLTWASPVVISIPTFE